MRRNAVLVSAVLLLCARTHAAGRVAIAAGGAPAAVIVTAAEPTRSAQFAAFELQYHLRKITGAEIPVAREDADLPAGRSRIFVGESRFTREAGLTSAGFAPQEYAVRLLPAGLVLIGRDAVDTAQVKYDENDPFAFGTWPDFYDDHATCYAVYDFLERSCGVRWYRPGAIGLVCPSRPTFEAAVAEVRRAPFFKYREPSGMTNMSEGYEAATGLWSRQKDAVKLAEMDALAYPDLVKKWGYRSWNYTHAKRGEVRKFLHRMRAGGERYSCNHSFYGYYNRFLNQPADPKAAALFAGRKPDWFAQGYPGLPPQMCYTNPEFIAQVVRDAREYFDGKGAKPGAVAAGDYFALVPMDNSSYCTCPRCAAETNAADAAGMFSNSRYSNHVFNFCNKVAKEVAATHPEKILSTLAYASYAYPPSFPLEKNMSVGFCLHTRNIWSPGLQENDLKLFDAWAAREKGRRFFLFLYYCFPAENSRYGDAWYAFPGFFSAGIDQWFKRFAAAGVRGAYFCGWGQDVEAYLTLKLLDDPAAPAERILDDYFTGLYGPAGPAMKKVYREIERIYSSPESYPADFRSHQTEKVAWENLGTAENMARLAGMMADARRAGEKAGDDARARIALFDKAVWECMEAGRTRWLVRQWRAANRPPRGLSVPRLAAAVAGGDPALADFTGADTVAVWLAPTGEPAACGATVRLVHDAANLYVAFTDPAGEAASWDLLLTRNRAGSFHRTTVAPDGSCATALYGDVGVWKNGAKSTVKTADGLRTVSVAIPLGSLLPGGVEPGWRLYGNIVRRAGGRTVVWTPTVPGAEPGEWFNTMALQPGTAPWPPIKAAPGAKRSGQAPKPETVAPGAVVETVDVLDLATAADDLLQGKAFEAETKGMYWFHRGVYRPAKCAALTDAITPRSPVDDLMLEGTPERAVRWDLGPVPPEGRTLTKLRAWWHIEDGMRSAVHVKFSVRDAASGEWRDVTGYMTVPPVPSADNTFKVLTVDLSGQKIAGFDAIRMTDGSGLVKKPGTRWIELDAF